MERNSISLNLGDIIKLTSPSNDNLHNKLFLITYIDRNRLEIRDEFTIEQLNISNAEFSDKSIKGIEIIQRSESKGYAEINGLIEGKWINIYFKGDVPFIVVGEIVSKEMDMIEIKLHPDESYIYLDFEYSGLKEEFNIDKIVLREKPKTLTTKQNDELNSYEVERTGEEDIEEKQQSNNGEVNENLSVAHANNTNEYNINDDVVKGEQSNAPLPYDDLLDDDTLGEDLGFIETTSKVPQKEMRYGLKMQLDDLIGSVINSIELKKRTPKVHKEIQLYVERITLLREQFSNFDKNGNISNILKKSSDTIISDNILDNNKSQPLWFYYGNVMHEKIYKKGTDTDGGMFVYSNIIKDVNDYLRYTNKYQTTRQQKFRSYIDDVINPYISSKDELLFSIFNSKHDINTISNNDGDLSKTDIIGEEVFNAVHKHLSGETVTFDSYITLPVKLFSIQYVKSPNINIMTKIIESEKRKLISNLFNDTNNNATIFKGDGKKVDETNLKQYKHHVKSKNKEDLKELLQRDLPLTSKLIHINHITKDTEKTPLSVKKSINELAKYTIDHDNISYDDYISIKNIIYDNKRDFFTFLKKQRRTYGSISVLNQGHYYDIFQKNTFYNYIFDKRKGPQEENDLLTDLLVKTYLREPVRRFNSIDEPVNSEKQQQKEYDIDKDWNKIYEKKYPNASKKDIYDSYILFLDKGIIIKPEDINKYSKNDDVSTEFIERQFTNSSFITYAKGLDNLRFLTHLISFGNASLVNDNFESMMDNYKLYLNSLNSNDKKTNTVNYGSGKCDINIQLSKKYISEEELEDDNNKELEYDKEYDDTYYDAINIYAEEKNSMTNEQFETYLSEKMKEVHELDEDGALDMAKTIINGKKMIVDGDYALLELYDDELVSIRIYKRINSKWVLDEEATTQHENNFSLLIDGNRCPQTVDCGYDSQLSNTSDCLSTREKKEKINKVFVEKMIIEFKHVYSKKESELKLLIAQFGDKLRRQQTLNNKIKYQYSEKANRISNFYNFQDMSIISPLHSMRDQILENEDFAGKQQDIIAFVNKYLRKPNMSNLDAISENKYMLYCKDTNQAIFPLFLYELANTFDSGKKLC